LSPVLAEVACNAPLQQVPRVLLTLAHNLDEATDTRDLSNALPRRQIKRNFQKPLIVGVPKGLLRLPVWFAFKRMVGID
jgi:hypothetical protein